MSDDEDNQFEFGTDPGAIYSAPASDVTKNGYVVIRGRPCKVVEVSSGRHKIHFIGIDIFTGKKLEDIVKDNASVDIPNVERTEYNFYCIDDDFLHLTAFDGGEKNDVRVPEGDIGDTIRSYEEAGRDAIIVVISSMGEECAIAIKEP